jgi:L-aspartate oxidase
VCLSLQHLDPAWVLERFPTVAEGCRAAGLNLATDRIPVGPAAHFMMGGVETDLWGRTSVPGLFAAGEVACTGVHGANRLASNSLLAGLVFGARAAVAMTQPPRAGGMDGTIEVQVPGVRTVPAVPRVVPRVPTESEVRGLMWESVGLERHREGLERALAQLDAWYAAAEPLLARGGLDEALWRVASIVTVGRLIARAALRREETRGGHARADFPARDDVNWKIHVGERKAP